MSRLAVITDPDWGWLSIRIRWKQHIPHFFGNVDWLDLEDFSGWEGRTPYARRLKWLQTSMQGRRAAKAAYAKGCRDMLVATLQYAPFFPLYPDVRYFVYGDVTPRQYDELYCNEFDDRPRKRYLRKKLERLNAAGHKMLCMSPWYRDGLVADYGASPEQAVLLRPLIDTDMWQPKRALPKNGLDVLFIGGDFARKNGPMLVELASESEFAACRWHFITAHRQQNTDRLRFYNGLTADQPEMRALVEGCDVLVLPTCADCYSHAAIEAGAAGLPTIITDVGGIGDIVSTGQNGVLLPKPDKQLVREALRSYLADPERLRREGCRARELVEERNSVPVHMSILKGLID